MPKRKPQTRSTTYTQANAHGAASKFGQVIGEAFADAVLNLTADLLNTYHPDYILLKAEEGRELVKLEMMGGTFRQIDNVIIPKDSDEPVALFESKWLKDARHHNDKGAWILQLREVSKRYPTVRGAAAILAGYWTEGVGVMFRSEAGVEMVLVATDQEVYGTLQEPLDHYLSERNLPQLTLDAEEIRGSLPRAWDLANFLTELRDSGQLTQIAQSWLNFEKQLDNSKVLGSALIKRAIDVLVSPLPEHPQLEKVEVALRVSTGNVIYHEFKDEEEAIEFIHNYFHNPQAILDKISPRKKYRGQ